jgi:D-alanyl-D-alanine carboxypeptidase (penicillin-binding protein 5/6)
MTAYLALRDLRMEQRIPAVDYHPMPGEAVLGLEPGERDTVRDLLFGMLLPSGGDAATTLAVGVAGSVPAFVTEMNRAAAKLGLAHTHYATPVGLDTPGNYSSASDLTDLARILLRKPTFAQIVETPEATLRDGAEVRHVVNHNDLVLRYPWIVGVKTGYTLDAHNVLVAAGRRHGTTLISAVLGTPTEAARDAASLELLRYGFSLYQPQKAIAKGQVLARPEIRNEGGELPLAAVRALRVWTRAGERPRIGVRAPAGVKGPVRRGRRLGRAFVHSGGRAPRSVPLIAAHSVPPPGVPTSLSDALPGSPSHVVLGIAGGIALASGLAVAVFAITAPRGDRLQDQRRGTQ